jgi:hypothetical protein
MCTLLYVVWRTSIQRNIVIKFIKKLNSLNDLIDKIMKAEFDFPEQYFSYVS